MNSINKECNPLKADYDECFNNWFRESFLKGDTVDTCAELFKKYQICVKKSLEMEGIDISEVKQSILGTSNEKQPPSN